MKKTLHVVGRRNSDNYATCPRLMRSEPAGGVAVLHRGRGPPRGIALLNRDEVLSLVIGGTPDVRIDDGLRMTRTYFPTLTGKIVETMDRAPALI